MFDITVNKIDSLNLLKFIYYFFPLYLLEKLSRAKQRTGYFTIK